VHHSEKESTAGLSYEYFCFGGHQFGWPRRMWQGASSSYLSRQPKPHINSQKEPSAGLYLNDFCFGGHQFG
jgi:hypothetical protein